ncbi:MAG: hypothetical protein ACJ77E_19685 [Gaiellaceae bacterium]
MGLLRRTAMRAPEIVGSPFAPPRMEEEIVELREQEAGRRRAP